MPLSRRRQQSSPARQPTRRASLPRAPRGLLHRGRSVASPKHVAQKRAIKHAALRDSGQRCVYCAHLLEFAAATLDHVYPLAKGGTHDAGNLVSACGRCNRLKGDYLPQEFFLRHPWAGANFILYARTVHRALKRVARRAVSLAYAEAA